jgi:hypothetical protein
VNTASQTPEAHPPQFPPPAYAAFRVPLGDDTSGSTAAAAAVLGAALERDGAATGEQLAEAERQAGILFDAAHVEAAVAAARDQARAEARAEAADIREQLAAVPAARRARDAVLRLCEGRRGDDLLMVAAVASAAECGSTALDSVPMTLEWTGSVHADGAGVGVIVDCVSSYGQRAALVLRGGTGRALARRLGAAGDVHAPCPTEGCGAAEDPGARYVLPDGWAHLEVAGVDGGLRAYCSPLCVSAALARADEDLDVRYGPGAADEAALLAAEAAEAGFADERGDVEDGAW